MSSKSMKGISGLVTDVATSYRMKQVKQRDTQPERDVKRILRRQGLHYRRRNRDLPGNPDFANRSRRWAIFVHGCFWHGHEGCPGGTVPGRNRPFWKRKMERNRVRDRRAVADLADAGFTVLVIWECELKETGSIEERIRQKLGPL